MGKIASYGCECPRGEALGESHNVVAPFKAEAVGGVEHGEEELAIEHGGEEVGTNLPDAERGGRQGLDDQAECERDGCAYSSYKNERGTGVADPGASGAKNDAGDFKDKPQLKEEVDDVGCPVGNSVTMATSISRDEEENDGVERLIGDETGKDGELTPSMTKQQHEKEGGVAYKARRPEYVIEH